MGKRGPDRKGTRTVWGSLWTRPSALVPSGHLPGLGRGQAARGLLCCRPEPSPVGPLSSPHPPVLWSGKAVALGVSTAFKSHLHPLGSPEALAGPVPSLAPFCSSVKWAAEGTTWGAGGGFSCDQSPGNRCAQVPGSFCSVSFPHVWAWKWVTTARCCWAESGVKAGSWPRTFWVWRGQPGHLSPSVLDKPARC